MFSNRNSRYLLRIGATFFCYGLLLVFLPLAFSIIHNLLADAPPLAMEIFFGSTELSLLVLGTVIIVISWIMQEAGKLKNEQDLVI
ncbi:DUF2975 domain-containing protein [Alteromonas sp. ASW11-130]|uniref:DUF2975 domain-containing protein n=1 Tax=Alteromonas sp. ASW11-130 TaxID=3015775 RepID=UPI002242065F|nr:DUF2975 domain-containing protein [Alteromonas sp. ASW11-130]